MKSLMVMLAVVLAPLASADELRDPTRPPVSAHRDAGPTEPLPVLSAVMGSGGNRVAIVNGRVVRSGDSVGTYLIQSVFEDGVRYRHAGVNRELYLPKIASFKRPSTAAAKATARVQ